MSKKDIIKRKKGEIIYDAKINGQERKIPDYKIILAAILFIIFVFIMLFD